MSDESDAEKIIQEVLLREIFQAVGKENVQKLEEKLFKEIMVGLTTVGVTIETEIVTSADQIRAGEMFNIKMTITNKANKMQVISII